MDLQDFGRSSFSTIEEEDVSQDKKQQKCVPMAPGTCSNSWDCLCEPEKVK